MVDSDNRSLEKQIDDKFQSYSKLDYAKALTGIDPRKRVFTFEPEVKTHGASHGSRRYFAARIDEFWTWYTEECTAPKYIYELIKETAPCRCFFDLEYYTEYRTLYNKDADSKKLLDNFLDVLCEFFEKFFNVKLNKGKNFLILDSSRTEKFSAHIIVHMPDGRLFPPPSPQGLREPIIKKLCEYCKERRVCLINSNKGEKYIFDTVVYSHDRDFRLLLSTKRQQKAALKYADYCRFYENRPADNDYQLFLDSLITPNEYEKFPIFDKKLLDNVVLDGKLAKKRENSNHKVVDLTVPAKKPRKKPNFVLK